MTTTNSLAGIGALIGDPGRATMLVTLMDGRALTAGELARAAGIAAATASGHLARMLEGGLLALERQGRHRYYRLANSSIAGLIEQLMAVSGELTAAAAQRKPVVTGPCNHALRRARLCYDHLAGEIAVCIADSMAARGLIEFADDGGAVTGAGMKLFAALQVDVAPRPPDRPRSATFCRPCLDWSERRPHIAGVVGKALYTAFLRADWLRAPTSGRVVHVTPVGLQAFERHFGVHLN